MFFQDCFVKVRHHIRHTSLISFLSAVVFMVAGQVTAAVPQPTSCYVIGIIDGDTINCLTSERATLKIRLAQIDAPEKAQPFGQKAKQVLSNLIHQKSVVVVSSSKDRYGRVLGEIHIDGRNINKTMVHSGYAWAYSGYVKDRQYFALQRQAKAARRGLWADSNPVYPARWRLIQK